MPTACPICLQESKDDEVASLDATSCSHSFCKPCLAGWVQHCESKTPQVYPGCPTCRLPIDTWDIVQLLGRPFQERQPMEAATAQEDIQEDPDEELDGWFTVPRHDPNEEPDEFFQTWLEENGAVKCPTRQCGIWIIKPEGCDRVYCTWCKRRFCFVCAQQGVPCAGHYDDEYPPNQCWYCGAYGYKYDTYYRKRNGTYYPYCPCQSPGFYETTELIESIADGLKSSRGGKKRLLWKGNSRTGKCTKTRRGDISVKRSDLASSSKTRTQSEGDKRKKRSTGKKANRAGKAQGIALTAP
ncbi:expressed unknown protein [Seminavis robusta]|uniref:RING-type domain-containing protein n=1 Tax=Seminavis robusta TaxID=568900 RepID=A0A9N8DCA9_9STRA|nr:expressed unknown protein [Seminavis robusta]|eukprot:Sro55_g032140.1 n/a (298) ;mRNA; r:7745-8638